MGTQLAIVGVFFDGYYDIWEDFLELFSRNWPDCPYPIYIVNGEKNLSYDKDYEVTVLHAGSNAEYSMKVQTTIKEIDADYYLLLLEDFFLEYPVKHNPLESILKSMVENNIYYLRMTLPEFLVLRKQDRYRKDALTGFSVIPPTDEYTVTCQPSIWKRDFLSQCIGTGNYNAWIFEGMYTYSKTAHTDKFLSKCRVDFTNPLGLRHGAVQGKMLPNVYRDIKRTGYEFKNKREVLNEKQYRKHLQKQRIKSLIPNSFQSIIKKFHKSGSVIDKYRDDIISQMKLMGLD